MFEDYDIQVALPHLPYWLVSIPFRLNTILNLATADVVLLGWWGLFTDSDSIKAIKIWWNAVWWTKLFWKKLIIFANSVGPFKRSEAVSMSKKYLSKADLVTVRDSISQNELSSLGISSKVFADPVFWFPVPAVLSQTNKVLAVSLRPLSTNFDNKSFKLFIKDQISQWYSILFVAMSGEDTKYFHNNNYSEFWNIVCPKDFNELLTVLNQVERCIWMRLHFLIASSLLEKEMVAISYSNKVKGVMDDIGIKSIWLESISNPTFCKPKNLDLQRKKVNDLAEYIKSYINEMNNTGRMSLN